MEPSDDPIVLDMPSAGNRHGASHPVSRTGRAVGQGAIPQTTLPSRFRRNVACRHARIRIKRRCSPYLATHDLPVSGSVGPAPKQPIKDSAAIDSTGGRADDVEVHLGGAVLVGLASARLKIVRKMEQALIAKRPHRQGLQQYRRIHGAARQLELDGKRCHLRRAAGQRQAIGAQQV